ncbi:MAG: hypothetical protein ABSF84_14235 [Acidimicrobiales bacterium]|jgi:hypothetical protein
MDLASKLQLKPGQRVEGVSVPDSVASVLPMAKGEAGDDQVALLIFVVDRTALAGLQARIVDAAGRDRLTWVAYPKSGQLGTDLNRDSLAAILTAGGARPVRQVAIDDVWSALRFRPG